MWIQNLKMVSFFCLCLLPLSVSAVSLSVEPVTDQFFSGEKFTVSCDRDREWTVKRRRTGDTQDQTCKEFGTMSGSSCPMLNTDPSDSGSYWCEDGSDRSEKVTITVTDNQLILEAPVLPVKAGSNVTLRCRSKHGYGLTPVIYKNGSQIYKAVEWTITNVNKSHEGSYSCRSEREKSEKRAKSEERELTVSDSGSDSTSDPLLVPVVSAGVVLLVLVLVLVLVLLRCRRQTGGGGGADAEEVTYADVRVTAAAAPVSRRTEEDTVYSGVRTQPREVTYGEVVINQKKKKRRPDTHEWTDPDVVYSSVRPRNTAGT